MGKRARKPQKEKSMTVHLNSYLNFRGNAREAITFYHSVFGGEVTISTFGDFQMSEAPEDKDLVMHAVVTTPNGLVIMAADVPSQMPHNPGDNFSLSLSGPASDDAELRGYWEKLTDGGTVTMPLEKAPWGDTFGMCLDKFGIHWMADITAEP